MLSYTLSPVPTSSSHRSYKSFPATNTNDIPEVVRSVLMERKIRSRAAVTGWLFPVSWSEEQSLTSSLSSSSKTNRTLMSTGGSCPNMRRGHEAEYPFVSWRATWMMSCSADRSSYAMYDASVVCDRDRFV